MVVMPTANGETAHIYPDAVHGITSTFPHQDYNGKTCPPRPWKLGKPCLEKPIAVFNRTSWSNEPRNLAERLPWLLQRLLKWLDAAASGSLNVAGDPLELPALPGQSLFPLLGFREASGGILQWIPHQGRWGYASISQLRGRIAPGSSRNSNGPTAKSSGPWNGRPPCWATVKAAMPYGLSYLRFQSCLPGRFQHRGWS